MDPVADCHYKTINGTQQTIKLFYLFVLQSYPHLTYTIILSLWADLWYITCFFFRVHSPFANHFPIDM